jgi:hypothetical protein
MIASNLRMLLQLRLLIGLLGKHAQPDSGLAKNIGARVWTSH